MYLDQILQVTIEAFNEAESKRILNLSKDEELPYIMPVGKL